MESTPISVAKDLPPGLVPDPVPIRVDENGDWRVGKTRVLVALVIEEYQDGQTPEGIVGCYDTLDLADVYGVIAYYLRHREQVEEYMEQREREADAVQEMIRQGPMHREREARFRELIAARRHARKQSPR